MPIKKSTTGRPIISNEESSFRLKFDITDDDGTKITTVNSMTMTIKDRRTGKVINSRDAIDVSAYETAGSFNFLLTADDNPIYSEAGTMLSDTTEETHIITFVITAVSGSDTLQLTENVWLQVINEELT